MWVPRIWYRSISSSKSSASKIWVVTCWRQACNASSLLIKRWLSMSSTELWIHSSVLFSFRISSSTSEIWSNSLTTKFENFSKSTCREAPTPTWRNSIFTNEKSQQKRKKEEKKLSKSTSTEELRKCAMLPVGWPAILANCIPSLLKQVLMLW